MIKLTKIILYSMVIISKPFLLYADPFLNVGSQQDGDFKFTSSGIEYNGTLYTGNEIKIEGNFGYINGKVIKSSSAISNDVVNINNFNSATGSNHAYNTKDSVGNRETLFGELGNTLTQMNINSSTLIVSNNFYVKNINLNHSNIIFDVDAANSLEKITITNGTENNISFNGNYNGNTIFGSSGVGNSITSLTIGTTATVGLNNDAYVDNLTLMGNNSTLNLNSGAKVYGNIISNIDSTGIVNINSNYDNGTNTVFGVLGNSIGTLNITNNNSLNLYNEAYIDNTVLESSSTLNFNANGGIHGKIFGDGTVNLNGNYSTDVYNTFFGKDVQSLNILNVGNNLNSYTFFLNNTAYIDNLNLTNINSILTIGENGGINGVINGSNNLGGGIIDINRNYDTFNNLSSNYFNTTFGSTIGSIKTLIIGDTTNGYNLSLGNLAYIKELVLNNVSSSLTLNSGSGVVGLISGNGYVNLYENYTTTDGVQDIVNSVYNTKFGEATKGLQVLNIGKNMNELSPEILANLNLNNVAYVNIMNISDNSQLTIEQNGGVSGVIQGSSNNQGIVNINQNFDTSNGGNYNTFFGTENNYLKQVNITNNSFTLSNVAYINNFNITNNDVYVDSKRLFTMTSNSQFNGSITLNNQENDKLIGVVLDENYITDLADLLSLINSGKNGTASIGNNNELFLDLLNKDDLTEGKSITIDTGKDYTNAALTYDGIFLNLQLDKTSPNELKLVVQQNRTPTTENVSEATLTAANIIDSWSFNKKSKDENILTSNLQSITNKQEFFHALTNLTPDVSGINIKIPTQSIINAVANINKRLNFLRIAKISENNYTFMNMLSKNLPPYYDEYIKKRNVWWEFFGGNLHQSNKENIFGYNANYYGGTIGYDIKINPSFVFGISYTFNQIDANDLDYIKSDRDDLKAMTHNLDLYSMLYNKQNYLAFNFGAGINLYEQKRKINFYNFNREAKADYTGFSYYAGVEYGFNIMLYNGEKNRKNDSVGEVDKKLGLYRRSKLDSYIMLTPKISLTYNNISIEKFTEKGAESANLVIDTKDYNSLDLNGGFTLTLSKGLNSYTRFQTILNGFVTYGIINDKIELSARYIDDDQQFMVHGFKQDDFTYNTGISVGFNFYDKLSVNLGYNYTFAEDFKGQLVKLSILYNF